MNRNSMVAIVMAAFLTIVLARCRRDPPPASYVIGTLAGFWLIDRTCGFFV